MGHDASRFELNTVLSPPLCLCGFVVKSRFYWSVR